MLFSYRLLFCSLNFPSTLPGWKSEKKTHIWKMVFSAPSGSFYLKKWLLFKKKKIFCGACFHIFHFLHSFKLKFLWEDSVPWNRPVGPCTPTGFEKKKKKKSINVFCSYYRYRNWINTQTNIFLYLYNFILI